MRRRARGARGKSSKNERQTQGPPQLQSHPTVCAAGISYFSAFASPRAEVCRFQGAPAGCDAALSPAALRLGAAPPKAQNVGEFLVFMTFPPNAGMATGAAGGGEGPCGFCDPG